MIFLDANVVLRLLVEPKTSEQLNMMNQAAQLMRSIRDGSVTETTSDALFAEVAYAD